MNVRIRTILLVTVTVSTLAIVMLLGLGNTPEVVAETDPLHFDPAPSEVNRHWASVQSTNAITTHTLTININPANTGTVNRNPAGSPGPGSNQFIYEEGEVVSLSAVNSEPGWEFESWSGVDASSNPNVSPADVTMDGDKSVTANFAMGCYQLVLGHLGSGTNPTPSPTNSTGCNSGFYHMGEVITLQANPAAHWQVQPGSWTGTQNGTSNIVVMPAGTHNAGVTYIPICFSLTINRVPLAGGTVSASTPNCPGPNPLGQYLEGTVVGIEAFEAPGYAFKNWSGAVMGNVNPNTVTMNSNKSVTANFALSCHPLSSTHSPPGKGSDPFVTNPDPPQSSTCNLGEFVMDEVIDLEATPIAGWRVDYWENTDDPDEGNEQSQLTFPALANGAGYVVGVTYIQKPTLQFKQPSYQVNETGIVATITVERVGSLTQSVDVWYKTIDNTAEEGNDYVAATGRLTFDKDQTMRSFEVQILDDNIKEGTEIVDLELYDVSSNAVLGTPSVAELLILDDEGDLTVQFDTSTYMGQEISPTIPVTITLFPVSTNNVFVEFSTQAITATSGVDYVEVPPTIIRFKPGETIKQRHVALIDDTLDEPDETVQLVLDNIVGALPGSISSATMIIKDDDAPPSLRFADDEYFAKEGDISTPVSVTLSAASAFTATVQYEVIELSVGQQLAGNITFAPGEVNKVVDIPTSSYQVGDTLNIILSEAQHATLATPSSATLTILDKDRSECHELSMDFTGHGKMPVATNLQKSVGCPLGQFVADESIFVEAEPDHGWNVNGWFGTLDDELQNPENIVRMPNSDHEISVHYITFHFLSSVSNGFTNYFPGTDEVEPNDKLSQANGPIQSGLDYHGGFPSNDDSFDNFYFFMPKTGSVQIELVDIPSGRDYNLLLLDSEVNLVGYSGFLSNVDEHISVGNLEKGLYYVSVFFNSGSTSTAQYRLNVDYD